MSHKRSVFVALLFFLCTLMLFPVHAQGSQFITYGQTLILNVDASNPQIPVTLNAALRDQVSITAIGISPGFFPTLSLQEPGNVNFAGNVAPSNQLRIMATLNRRIPQNGDYVIMVGGTPGSVGQVLLSVEARLNAPAQLLNPGQSALATVSDQQPTVYQFFPDAVNELTLCLQAQDRGFRFTAMIYNEFGELAATLNQDSPQAQYQIPAKPTVGTEQYYEVALIAAANTSGSVLVGINNCTLPVSTSSVPATPAPPATTQEPDPIGEVCVDNNGDGLCDSSVDLLTDTPQPGSGGIECIDNNGDGLCDSSVDLLTDTPQPDSGGIECVDNNGDGLCDSSVDLLTDTPQPDSGGIECIDNNGDGLCDSSVDLLTDTPQPDSGGIECIDNNGDGLCDSSVDLLTDTPQPPAPADSDGDGIPDSEDNCPTESGPATPPMFGCPDSDNDGVPDADDLCPDVTGDSGDGCLAVADDSDGDGFPDIEDDCPNEPGVDITYGRGCPDRDGDNLADHMDQCPDDFVQGVGFFNNPWTDVGCPAPDADGDGVGDDVDICPNLPGDFANNGCPDADGDGVFDDIDLCPAVAGTLGDNGCIDSDGDGVHDGIDFCPDVPGVPPYIEIPLGCPE